LVELVNREGRRLAGGDVGTDSQDRAILAFRAPSTGTF
jgi:hypothetical protein